MTKPREIIRLTGLGFSQRKIMNTYKEKRARRIRLFQGVVRRRPPQFIAIIYHMGGNYARNFKID